MQNNVTKAKKSVIENDDFFYRHPEMFRAKIDYEDEEDYFDDLNNNIDINK